MCVCVCREENSSAARVCVCWSQGRLVSVLDVGCVDRLEDLDLRCFLCMCVHLRVCV